MPLYEFICSLCRRPFTVLVGVASPPDNSACPHCGSLRAERRVSRFARSTPEDAFLGDLTGSIGEPAEEVEDHPGTTDADEENELA
jgi:putative FmdB family regulatory protein